MSTSRIDKRSKNPIMGSMEGKQKGIRWEKWMVNAVEQFGKRNGMDFSETVRFLVECELNERGYFRKDYEPGIIDITVNKPSQEELIEKRA
jgi:hypothetical protein